MKSKAFLPVIIFLLTFLFSSQTVSAQLFGPPLTISSTEANPVDVYAVDIDGDGDLDVLSASLLDSSLDSPIEWFENDGSGEFVETHLISNNVYGNRAMFPSDLDNDGDIDVIYYGPLGWFENDGTGEFGELQLISSEPNDGRSLYTADFDGDEDLDILLASHNDSLVVWFENEGYGGFGDQQLITTMEQGASSVYSEDLDGDGDMDVLASSSSDDKIIWCENDGTGAFGMQIIINDNADWAQAVFASDIDGDNDMDVLSASSLDNKIAWYENDGLGGFSSENIISLSEIAATLVSTSDLDGDGDLDVLSASYIDNNITWYENDGTGTFSSQRIISSNAPMVTAVLSSDIDGDGDLDVLSICAGDSTIAWYENLSGEGCIDITACNYQEEMWIDNGSCCYDPCGCTVMGAENYNSAANCDDGSCIFQVYGTVFFDENENGVMDDPEYGLSYQELSLSIFPESSLLITNSDGHFYVSVAGGNEYTFSLSESESFPYFTTPQTITYNATEDNWNQEIFFGISNELPEFNIDMFFYSESFGYPCDTLSNHHIWFSNLGNVPIDGMIELEYDSIFQSHVEVTPIDSSDGNKVWLSYENLLPGQTYYYEINLQTPTVEYIGEFLTSTTRIWGLYEEDTVTYSEKALGIEVTCGYDPNDKQVFPNGYSEMHYIENDTILEYLVRFQNTGNAPATEVRIIDTLDANLDIETFQLVANSHSVFTSINPDTREVEFYFQNIFLPDSVNNEPESHGLVSYKIRPTTSLPLLTELNNTAYIFFDNNPPIVTNTTWSTIYNCSLFEVNFTESGALLTATEGDNYQWYLDGEIINGATEQVYTATQNGDYSVEVNIDFPCSDISSSTYIVVTSIDEFYNNPISIFPNPMTRSAVIDLGNLKGNFTLDIFDIKGSLVRSENLNLDSGVINLERENLLSGQHLMRIWNNDELVELKFIVD